MTTGQPPEPPDVVKLINALTSKLDAALEAAKPKPDRTDRQVLDDILGGLGGLAEAVKGLAPAATTITPPPKPTDDAPAKPVRRSNPFTRHLSA